MRPSIHCHRARRRITAPRTITYAYTNNGNKAQFSWDGHDRLSKWNFPSPATPDTVSTTDFEQYGYDAAGNRLSLRRRDGRTLTFAYDNLNRMLSKLIPDGCPPIQPPGTGCPAASATRDVFYSYDILGRQLTAKFDSTSGADGITNGYDGFGNLASSTISMSGFSKTVSSLYDADNNRTRVTHPDAQAFTYAYDARDRLNGVYEGIGTGTALDGFIWNADDTLATRLEGGSSGAASYGYDAIGRLLGQGDTFPSFPGSNVQWTFGISTASQIVSETRDNDAYAFTGISTANKAYAVNGLNQYTAVAGTGHTYDANGNLTGDGTNAYIYGGENRLVSATAAGQTATLTYDPLGRLFQVVKGAANTRFLYDGDALVGEYDSGGNLTNRYLHGSNIAADDPLLWYVGSGTGTKRYLHADHLGSIVAGTNAGAAPTINAYDEYGVPAASNVGRFQYTGQIWLSELGLYHYKARLYSPTLGRFLQVDPVGYEGQLNLYAYVGDDPINTSDPTGLLGQGDNLSENDKICTGSLIKCAQGGGVTGGAAGVSQAFSEGRSGQQGGQAGGYAVPRVESMYAQRAASGDPYAALALDFGKDQPTNSLVPAARDAMVDALVIKHGGHIIGAGHFSRPLIASTREQRLAAMAEYRQIRAQLAAAYVRATQTDPNRRLNPGQIYDIHKPVFSAHGLSMRLFGGSSVTGTRAEAVMSAILWCPRCILQ